MDPTMSEVPPPRTSKAAVARVSGSVAAPAELPPQRPAENLMARFAFPEDSDLEADTPPISRPERTDTMNVEYAKIMARLDDLESLLEKHISNEASAKATICENMEKYASTVTLNNALLTTSIEVMKGIQADVNRITWHQFEAVVKPERATDVCDDKKSDHSGAGQTDGQSGGCGWVASKEPTPMPGHNTTRIETSEFIAIKGDGNLKHVWVYIDACDDRAHKMRVQSLSDLDVSNIYANGGCLFPYMKSCGDIEKFYDFRIKYLVGQHYTHCRPKS